MRFALNVPNFGEYGDARLLAAPACEAEESGWDGFFVWDHIAWEGAENYADLWISLSTIAVETSSIRIGPMVTPLPRRRPWKVAPEAATLDRLSGGRLFFGAGLGGCEREVGFFGEEPGRKRRAAMLDGRRESGEPCDIRVTGSTNGESPDEARRKVTRFAEAGATWWDENLPPSGMSLGETCERVRLGPPDIA